MKKHLVFYWYVSVNNVHPEIYEMHKRALKRYYDRFDDAVFVISMDNSNNRSEEANALIDELRLIMGNVETKFIVKENNRDTREAETYYNEVIKRLEYEDGLIFYAHTKGVSEGDDYLSRERLYNWINLMYYGNLEHITEVEHSLTDNETEYISHGTHYFDYNWPNQTYKWHYSGSFAWVNCERFRKYINENRYVKDIIQDRYLSESFLGNVYPSKYAYSRFKIFDGIDYDELPNAYMGESEMKEYRGVYKEIIGEGQKSKCCIVVPIYKTKLEDEEKASLKQLNKVLGRKYDIVLVGPTAITFEEYDECLSNEYGPIYTVYNPGGEYFTDRMAYAKMVCNKDFYKHFLNYKYILIYQTDCWVFRDELQSWCEKGYDYIGAPFFLEEFVKKNKRVGNGGFSLRNVEKMIEYLEVNNDPNLPHFNTDDGYYASNYNNILNIAPVEDAAKFSFEVFPKELYDSIGQLPFGCHAFKKYDWTFWKNFIKLEKKYNMSNNITCCILNYKDTTNAKRWYEILKNVYPTYIIDTYVLDNNADDPYTEYPNDSHILREHNVYNGGQRIIAYNKTCENNSKWMFTVDADIEINDDQVEKLLERLHELENRTDIGVYECSADYGSKCMGATQIIPDNIHLFNHGTNEMREVEGAEGWFRVARKEICDKIYPYCNLEDNKYGWGTGEAYYYLAKQMGLKTVIDDRVLLHHPAGLSYDNKPAVEERLRFMARFDELGIKTPTYKTASEIKTLVCCIGKNENSYIREYVDWYKHIGVTNICLYDNNDADGEEFEDVIGRDIEDGYVIYNNWRGKKNCQLPAYQDCYDRFGDSYDWILFIDCGDEYLDFTHHTNINDYLVSPQFKNYDLLHINLMTYGDSDTTEVTDKPLKERFPNPIPYDTPVAYSFPENNHVSSIVRGGLGNRVKWQGVTHTPSPCDLRCCNNIGFACDPNSPFVKYDFQLAYFRHYTTKTAKEYCNKMRRGFPDQIWDGSRIKNLVETRFFRTNKVTEEKVKIFMDELNIDVSNLLKKEFNGEKRKDVQIFSLCYAKKDFEFLDNSIITPLQCGASNGTDVCKLKDNTGNNISQGNFFYVENTGTYWIWQNVKDAKYKGQMQYRRPLVGVDETMDFDKVFTDYDVITCKPFHHPSHKTPTKEEPMVIPADTVQQGYAFSNCGEDLYILGRAVKEMYPAYAADWDKYITHGPNLYYSNGFIMKAEDYDKYCEFLFNCLNGYVQKTRIRDPFSLYAHVCINLGMGKYRRYDDPMSVPMEAIKWQTEIGGFLSERLWTLWLQHNFKDERILKLDYDKQEEGMFT